ncbi:MAG: hypothetical protein BJ554DRAFT_5400 [Olpidium bornovanus]|uniref:Uncharacterized protein n=1 Tax=Olpidium bornovanus TaxID=278681 RepID=A0A8H7ZZJ8_9FUNG|nr:MAG: hypothetical protein BJ554DRAFT_5400 [Olpidium bornovanus]
MRTFPIPPNLKLTTLQDRLSLGLSPPLFVELFPSHPHSLLYPSNQLTEEEQIFPRHETSHCCNHSLSCTIFPLRSPSSILFGRSASPFVCISHLGRPERNDWQIIRRGGVGPANQTDG